MLHGEDNSKSAGQHILNLASNPAAEENAAWIQLFRLSQQFPEIWDF